MATRIHKQLLLHPLNIQSIIGAFPILILETRGNSSSACTPSTSIFGQKTTPILLSVLLAELSSNSSWKFSMYLQLRQLTNRS